MMKKHQNTLNMLCKIEQVDFCMLSKAVQSPVLSVWAENYTKEQTNFW
jgi:hypothetical protein